jgi:nucleoside-diphosphate-sugar epimerase
MLPQRLVLVTGGASFTGSHLVDSLISSGAEVNVPDGFSSGWLENLEQNIKKVDNSVWKGENLTVCEGDLKDKSVVKAVMAAVDVVFHLAVCYRGRG